MADLHLPGARVLPSYLPAVRCYNPMVQHRAPGGVKGVSGSYLIDVHSCIVKMGPPLSVPPNWLSGEWGVEQAL